MMLKLRKVWLKINPRWSAIINKKYYSFKWRSRNLLLLSIVVILSISISATAITSYKIVKGLLLDSLKEQTLLKTRQGQDDIDNWLAIRKTEIKTLANSGVVRSLDWSVMEPYLQSELKRLQTFLLMGLVTPDSALTNTHGDHLNVKDREFFQRSMTGETIAADPIIGRTTKQLQIQISSPIPAERGTKPAGVLMGGIPINRVVEVISNLHQGKGSYAFALNSQGVPIAHPNTELIGTPEKAAKSFLNSRNPRLVEITQQMVAKRTNIELLQLDGKWSYVAYTPLKEANWSVALIVPKENIESPLQALNLLATVLGGLLLIGLISAWRQVQLYEQIRDRALISSQQAQQLSKTLKELQNTQAQLIHTEKMSSLGQLVAGVAHEINNPANFIHANLNHASVYSQDILDLLKLYQQTYPNPTPEISDRVQELDIEFLAEDLPKLMASMQVGTKRIRQIVLSLRNFSRLDEADMKFVDVNEGLDNTLMILNHRLTATPNQPEIQIVKKYGDLPLVECYAGQLNQVFMNVLVNAIDAVEESLVKNEGQIRIQTELTDEKQVIIQISDNGIGMSEEIKQRVFDYMFTTKPVGKGIGLGMAIAYQIVVDKHRGTIEVDSTPGYGTEFTIVIPLTSNNY
ncbi:histidine kinase [Nostoc sp. 'Peltigera membranacea cyanobiont' 210A]|uniref:sensor histidine kinase n=1 Tax=Nostoc sp. 'Peltigera membranacea cyanobiont' 210A TaxID=2014529 RepID=UPI000B9521EF|nr:ATP-binding protein [Nostoc sp. 'Peltigera membranacea cyanobiont' 210A]OYD94028.1 histidine kinase [Nostoc sp. 'Peltigera membranacea cyanobiont' 210A]